VVPSPRRTTWIKSFLAHLASLHPDQQDKPAGPVSVEVSYHTICVADHCLFRSLVLHCLCNWSFSVQATGAVLSLSQFSLCSGHCCRPAHAAIYSLFRSLLCDMSAQLFILCSGYCGCLVYAAVLSPIKLLPLTCLFSRLFSVQVTAAALLVLLFILVPVTATYLLRRCPFSGQVTAADMSVQLYILCSGYCCCPVRCSFCGQAYTTLQRPVPHLDLSKRV